MGVRKRPEHENLSNNWLSSPYSFLNIIHLLSVLQNNMRIKLLSRSRLFVFLRAEVKDYV